MACFIYHKRNTARARRAFCFEASNGSPYLHLSDLRVVICDSFFERGQRLTPGGLGTCSFSVRPLRSHPIVKSECKSPRFFTVRLNNSFIFRSFWRLEATPKFSPEQPGGIFYFRAASPKFRAPKFFIAVRISKPAQPLFVFPPRDCYGGP